VKSFTYAILSVFFFIGLGAGCDDAPRERPAEPSGSGAAALGQAEAHTGQAPAAPAPGPAAARGAAGPIQGTVAETMNAAGYTYVRVETGGRSVWAAVMQTPISLGDRVEIAGGAPMRGFHSKTLNRTFDEILFANGMRVLGGDDAPTAPGSDTTGTGATGSGAALPPGHPPIDPGSAAAPTPPAAPPSGNSH